ncbi:Vms1/Ankzf1 family peptidyl-tRNA hydrolase [Pseudonocardia acidicola]|uniref:Peptide subunit release factor 1 (ERF1) n=1 Tax=Pseudonocardia acidicola TaxID=2724939 RepID=A0ABX1S7V0_9PSEU|nr:Vms1/Ankzf1 family peptidyl-tRNA hydrolase [Pseudonocardia acidicola]NMH97640.1 hypothetical protein [Pseudonocardia acidicola]
MHKLTSHGTHVLRDMYSRPGPIASVYFSLRATGEEEALPRWHVIARELAHHGAGDTTIETVRGRVLGAVPGSGVLATFVAGDEVLLSAHMSEADQPDLARYGGLPHFLPLLDWLQNRPPYVVALVDRTGADITVHPGGTATPVRQAVSGPDDEIERNAPGGWAQGRYQHRAEDSWEHNATRVAEVLAPHIRRHAIRLLILAGDVRALQYLEKHLPTQIKHKIVIHRVSGGRSPDGSWQLRAEQVADDVRLAVAAQTALLLGQLDEERRPGGCAVDGVEPTLAALAQGRARILLLTPDTGEPRMAWYGPGPADVAAEPELLERAGLHPEGGPLVDVAVRSALLSGAGVRVLAPTGGPEAPLEGIGALCRFP